MMMPSRCHSTRHHCNWRKIYSQTELRIRFQGQNQSCRQKSKQKRLIEISWPFHFGLQANPLSNAQVKNLKSRSICSGAPEATSVSTSRNHAYWQVWSRCFVSRRRYLHPSHFNQKNRLILPVGWPCLGNIKTGPAGTLGTVLYQGDALITVCMWNLKAQFSWAE